MLSDALQFLLEVFLGLFSLALLLRFYLQWLRAPARNPLGHFLSALTNWAVLPARRIVPGLWGLDLATLVLAWITEYVLVVTTYMLGGFSFGPAIGIDLVLFGVLAFIQLVKRSLYILMFAVIIQAVLSWVGTYSPATPILNALTKPFLRVFQRRIPPVGNVDLSPLFLLVVCQLLVMALAAVQRSVAPGLG